MSATTLGLVVDDKYSDGDDIKLDFLSSQEIYEYFRNNICCQGF